MGSGDEGDDDEDDQRSHDVARVAKLRAALDRNRGHGQRSQPSFKGVKQAFARLGSTTDTDVGNRPSRKALGFLFEAAEGGMGI